MASSVGCWTSSSKVGRSGFSLSFIIKSCEDVLRLIRLYTFTSRRYFGLYIRPRFWCSTALFIRLYYYRCISAFLWVFWVSSPCSPLYFQKEKKIPGCSLLFCRKKIPGFDFAFVLTIQIINRIIQPLLFYRR